MKQDIEFPSVKGISVAVARKLVEGTEQYEWLVYLINNNEFALANVLVASRGYGTDAQGEPQKTSTLRHLIEYVAPNDYAVIEPIDSSVFHLCNEYWVSYYIGEFGKQIYDKKFLFLPDTIVNSHISYIPQIALEGVLHV